MHALLRVYVFVIGRERRELSAIARIRYDVSVVCYVAWCCFQYEPEGRTADAPETLSRPPAAAAAAPSAPPEQQRSHSELADAAAAATATTPSLGDAGATAPPFAETERLPAPPPEKEHEQEKGLSQTPKDSPQLNLPRPGARAPLTRGVTTGRASPQLQGNAAHEQ